MKTYTFADLKKISKEQSYVTGALENQQKDRLLGFNNPKLKDVNKQLADIEKRLKTEILPDGIYNVLLALAVNKQNAPDKYPILKGTANNTPGHTNTIYLSEPAKTPEVLTWAEALKINTELAQLREENKTLIAENARINSELENSFLNEEIPGVDIGTMLKEHAPTLMAVADKYFNLQERKISLEEKKLDLKNLHKPAPIKTIQIEPGSKEHLILIETYFKNGNEEKLNFELAKLNEVNPELYVQVLERLNNAK